MKMSIEVDLTPKEARKLMGLPDVEAMQQKVVDLLFNEFKKGLSDVKDPEKLLQRIFPIAQGFDQWQKFMPDFVKQASGDEGKGKSEEK